MTTQRIFVVDDDLEVLASVDALLTANGYRIEPFASPCQMLAQVKPTDIGCVITDLKMPEMDGLELQQALLKIESCLALIMVTGYAEVTHAVTVMEQGALTLIEKPYESRRLLEAVERGLEFSRFQIAARGETLHARQRFDKLTPEERAILDQAIHGLPSKAIGLTLKLSQRTVERRRMQAFKKLQVESVAEAAMLLALAQTKLELLRIRPPPFNV
jgi:FixJ family two-component response regulator